MIFKSPAKHRTPLYRAKSAYSSMKRRCVGGKAHDQHPAYADVNLRMTLEEWLEWAVPRYEKFIKEYPDTSPAAARKGDLGDYQIGNIEIISHSQNALDKKTLLHIRPDGTKMCCRCRVTKPLSDFSKNKWRKNGLNHNCRSCCSLFFSESKHN